tara:strand:- start:2152 stop:2472 length:321 start_codon:yes stop_codon:yes gene_type:complete
MAQLSNKIRKYLDREVDFYNEVLLQNDGQGDYISFWSDSIEKSKPTNEQLNAFESDATKLENNNQVVATRKSLYGTPEEQLEILVEQGVDKLIERNTKIKTDNPKE